MFSEDILFAKEAFVFLPHIPTIRQHLDFYVCAYVFMYVCIYNIKCLSPMFMGENKPCSQVNIANIQGIISLILYFKFTIQNTDSG